MGGTPSGSAAAALVVSVDRAKCCGYAICAEICPDVYKLDADGFVQVDGAFVGSDLAAAAREGAESCPELAITVRDVGHPGDASDRLTS